jgi:hypothetical protein
MTREELDAKLATISGVSDERWLYFRTVTSDIQGSVRKLHTTVILTGISSVLTVLLGVGGINASLLSGMVGAFESGQGMGKQGAAITQRMDKFDSRMEKFDTRMESLEAQLVKRDEALRKELAQRDADLRVEMDKRDAQLRAEMAERNAKLRTEMGALQREMAAQRQEMRALRNSIDRIAAHLARER